MNAPVIPATAHPFPVYARMGPPPRRSASDAVQRRGLLAKIHIAKAQMGLTDGEYEMILSSFKVASAADLGIGQLEDMVKLFKHHGWKPAKHRRRADPDAAARLEALRRRCVEIAKSLDGDGAKRLAGLAARICGTAQLVWCREAAKLERLLAVLGKIMDKDDTQ